MWLSGGDLTLSGFRQTKDAFTSVLSRPDTNPTLSSQQGQSPSECGAVHGKAGTQRLLVCLADNAEGGQQTKLGDFDERGWLITMRLSDADARRAGVSVPFTLPTPSPAAATPLQQA
jgi:hypothetical protein